MQSEQLQATDLRGKVAIVTGASSGIGEAIAEELVKQGVRGAFRAAREPLARAGAAAGKAGERWAIDRAWRCE